jgi:ubiquinone/menaquinone biosynthesis C-methylase UbiE
LAEFTGERVIPGLVDDNLFNEHLSRYRFAARFADGRNVLDAGCGSGYGAAEFSNAASVIAADISSEAIQHARQNFSRPGLTLLQASCEALPFATAHFDLVTAFEVIEHLEHWQQLLEEANRVLKSTGVLLVSTPNKCYYAESRGAAGPNPFHCHEFEFAEFEAALYAVFPHVRLWTQNHSEAIVFAPQHPAGAVLEASGDACTDTAHFFIAACSRSAIAVNEVYAWVPSSANLLREREHHIAKLEGECAKKDAWLRELVAAHTSLHSSHNKTLEEMKQRNEWAAHLDAELAQGRAAITRMEQDAAVSLAWAQSLQAQIDKSNAEILRLQHAAVEREAELVDRTAWARSMEQELEECTAWATRMEQQLEERASHLQSQMGQIAELTRNVASLREERLLMAGSKWIRLGRTLGIGPVLHEDLTAGEE